MKPPTNKPIDHMKMLNQMTKMGRSMLQIPQFQPGSGTMSIDAVEQLLGTQGIPMKLSRPLPCPNVKTVSSETHPPDCDLCQNGFIYFGEIEFMGAFYGNSNSREFDPQGAIDRDFSQVVIPAHDLKGRQLLPGFFCKLELPAVPVSFYERVQASQTGVDRLQFPAVSIDFIADSSGRKYVNGVDYVINPFGRVEWRSMNRPGYDTTMQQGRIYSISYTANASYTIVDIPSQPQVVQTQGPGGPGTPNVLKRMPSIVTVRREWIPTSVNGQRLAPQTPPDGSIT